MDLKHQLLGSCGCDCKVFTPEFKAQQKVKQKKVVKLVAVGFGVYLVVFYIAMAISCGSFT